MSENSIERGDQIFSTYSAVQYTYCKSLLKRLHIMASL
jgi:hypothetical protein